MKTSLPFDVLHHLLLHTNTLTVITSIVTTSNTDTVLIASASISVILPVYFVMCNYIVPINNIVII